MELLVDRGCPRKLAREVAHLVKGGPQPDRTPLFEAAVGWSLLEHGQARREVLVMSGERGRGKSYAAAVILQWQRIGSKARWANARHIASWIHHSKVDRPSATHLKRIHDGHLVVIDDLGWEHLDAPGFVLGSIVGLIDDRIQNETRTVITTNLNESQFQQRYGDALHDRVRGYGTWIDAAPGPSMRGR